MNIASLFAEELEKSKLRTEISREQKQIRQSREDVNAFAEYAFTDEQGKPLIQAPLHCVLQNRIMTLDRSVTWFPIEHGKTTQIKIALVWLLGKYPERNYAYVSSKLTQARKVVGAVKREIESNEKVKRVFPKLKPETGTLSAAPEMWGNEAIRIQGARPGSKDPSLGAYGVDGQISGARLHGVFIDNVCDRTNTASEIQREGVLELIDSDILSRVLEGGFAHIVDTAWHKKDAPHIIASRDQWHEMKFDAHDGENGRPLWPEAWSWERLEAKRGEVGQTAYDRMMRNKPLSDSMQYFKTASIRRARCGVPWYEHFTPEEDELPFICTGVDLATRKGQEYDLTVFTTVKREEYFYQIINIVAERAEAGEIIRRALDIYRRFHADSINAGGYAQFVVEDNAAQVYIEQMLKDAAILEALGATYEEIMRIVVKGRTTTSSKRDIEYGIPGIAADLEMNRWKFPDHPEIDALQDEMETWTPSEGYHTGDRLMSLWIAREGIRDDLPQAVAI